MKTVGEVISRARNLIKSVNQDSFVTDRFIYSIISKHSAWLIKREDGLNKLMKFISAFDTLQYVELVEVDKIEANCTGIKSYCTIKRTAEKLPRFIEGYWGPLIRNITSIDGSTELNPTTSSQFTKLSNSKSFKYNKTKYYWIANGYIYFPNIEWDAVSIQGIFDDDISKYSCDEDKKCLTRQEQNFNVPEYLHGELENHVKQDLAFMLEVPSDLAHDKQNISR